MSRRVSFGCDPIDEEQLHPKIFSRVAGKCQNNKRVIIGVWSIRVPQSPENSSSGGFSFLKRVGAKMARAFSLVSLRRSSRKVNSSSNFVRSRSYAESVQLDSHRAEAIEDCIEFLNSSSSLQKSNSVS